MPQPEWEACERELCELRQRVARLDQDVITFVKTCRSSLLPTLCG